jgi:hypothetical protein
MQFEVHHGRVGTWVEGAPNNSRIFHVAVKIWSRTDFPAEICCEPMSLRETSTPLACRRNADQGRKIDPDIPTDIRQGSRFATPAWDHFCRCIAGVSMTTIGWGRRARLFVQRFWQPTSACMTCMPGSLGNVWSWPHWTIALHTGLATGILAVLLTFTPAGRLYGNRYGNAAVVGALTALGDAYAHPSHYGTSYAEAILTGAASGLLTLAGSYLFEDRARRLRAAWARISG